MKRLLACVFFVSAALFAQEIDDFDTLMGKMSCATQTQDIATLEHIKSIYAKNKSAQYSEESSYKIPSIIHFIWLGPHAFPPESVENIRAWIAHHPGWRLKFWTDREREAPCEEMEVVLVKDFSLSKLGPYYAQSQNWKEKTDILRYEILLQEGGVCPDPTVSCLKSFSGMHRGYDFFCGLETSPVTSRNVTCSNAIIGARPLHPTIAKAVDLIEQRWGALGEKFRGKDEYSRMEMVIQRTYIALTDALKETLDREGNVDIVFPKAYFFAKSGLPALYAKHFSSGAKKTKAERSEEQGLGKLRRKNRNLILLLSGLVAFNTLVIGVTLLKKRRL